MAEKNSLLLIRGTSRTRAHQVVSLWSRASLWSNELRVLAYLSRNSGGLHFKTNFMFIFYSIYRRTKFIKEGKRQNFSTFN